MLPESEIADVMRAVVADSPVLILLVDREHRIAYLNHFEHGFTPDQVLGLPVVEYIPPPYGDLVRGAVEKVFATGEPVSYETGVDTPRGRTHYRTWVGPVRMDSELRFVSMISYDITAEREARQAAARELAHRAALERVDRAIVSGARVPGMLDAVLSQARAFFECDRAFLIHPCDPSAADFAVAHEAIAAGVPAAEGRRLPMDLGMAERLRHALDHPGETIRHDAESPSAADGERGEPFGSDPVLGVAFQPDGDAPWYLGIHGCREDRVAHVGDARLLTAIAGRLAEGLERLHAQRALRQSEERFRLLVENAPEAIVLLDVDTGRFVDVNEKAVELFGFSREELLTKGTLDVSPPTQADGVPSTERAAAMIRAANEGASPVFEWLHRSASGDLLECEVRLLRLPYTERHWIRGSVTDISARKEAERENERLSAQLAHAQKMQAVGQLTGGIAHDFNNLLTVIGSSIAMIEMDAGDAERTLHLAELAKEACDRAAELTQRLLAFSRQQPLRPRSVDLAKLIRGMEGLLRRTLGETIRIETVLADDLWRCEVDPAQLENAILNLSINARDALPEGGCLTIEAGNVILREGEGEGEGEGVRGDVVQGDYVLLTVRDDGEGIPPEALPKVFDPFFTTKEVGKGSGLGLSMVYGFTKQSRGHIEIDSSVGEGTIVQLFLPRSDAPLRTTPPEPVEAVEAVGSGELILVVEDDESLRRLIGSLLRRLGFEALAAEDGPTALRLLGEHPDVALMLSDMVLPGGLNGAELARRVHEVRDDLPVLFMSGYTEDAVMNDGRLEEGVDLLQKPFDIGTLAIALVHALNAAAAER